MISNDEIKKKLEEQDLLGGGKKKEAAPVTPEKEGYDEQERERLDKLFNEPVTND